MEALIPSSVLPRVLIVGAGFGGLQMARRLDKKKFQVILLDENNYHTFQPLLYQVATGGLEPDSIAYPIRKIFPGKKNVLFRSTKALKIIPEKNILTTSIGDIKYDSLIVASGTTTNFFGLEDARRNSMTLKSLPEALDFRSFILQNFENALQTEDKEERKKLMHIVIVGGGATGVEMAGAMTELKRHVLPSEYPELNPNDMQITLIESLDKLLPPMSKPSQEKSKLFLEKMGVKVMLNTKVESYNGDKVKLNSGEEIFTQSVIWTAGVMGKIIEGTTKATITKGNRLLVDSYNRVKGYENIFAIGDVAAMMIDEKPAHPMLAPVAIQQGKNLARNLNSPFVNNWKPFHYFDKGTMAAVGRNKAVADIRFIHFQGLFAWLAWLFIHLMLLVGFRNRVIVFINWMWSYFSYDKAVLLIIRPFRKDKQ